MTDNTFLPNAFLETYVIVPLQLTHSHIKEIQPDSFCQQLQESHWQKIDTQIPDSISSKGLTDQDKERIRYQKSNYFHPFVQTFWFDNNLVKRFRHTELAQLDLTLNDDDNIIELDANCDLYYFDSDIILLALHVRSRTAMPYQKMLDCLNQLRRLYPPFLKVSDSKINGGHFPSGVALYNKQHALLAEFTEDQLPNLLKKANEQQPEQLIKGRPWAEHWNYLLAPIFTGEKDKHGYMAQQLGDDRAAVASFVQLDCTADDPAITELDQGNLTRLCFADSKGSDPSPYSIRFLKHTATEDKTQSPFEAQYCYDRFWYKDEESTDKPSRIMNCGYAFCWLGDKRDKWFFTDEKDGAPAIFRHLYVPMAIIAHFQQTKLLVLTKKRSAITEKNWNKKELQNCQKDFIHFTQTYWFSEITPQQQGLELFDMWRRELRLDALYQENREQLQDVMTHVQSEQTITLNRAVIWLTILSLCASAIGISIGLLGINTFSLDPKNTDNLEVISIKGTGIIHLLVENIVFILVPCIILFFLLLIAFIIMKMRHK